MSDTTLLRLIERGFLDEHSVDALGAGASPRAVAATRRVQRAKTLLDETAMPIAAVAFAAGFSSIRRFNAAFRAVYRRPPSSIRRGRPPAIRRRALAS